MADNNINQQSSSTDGNNDHEIINKAWNLFSDFGSVINGAIGNLKLINRSNKNEDELPNNLDINKEGSLHSSECYETTRVSESFLGSDSEDSDEEIFTNLSTMERITDPNRSSFRNSTNDSSVPNGDSKSSPLKQSLNKIAIARVLLHLNSVSNDLKVTIIQVYDLIRDGGPRKGSTGHNPATRVSISPYNNSGALLGVDQPRQQYFQVHVTILPEKKQRMKTRLRQGPDPMFNESFTGHQVVQENMNHQFLRLRLYASPTNTFPSVIGETFVNLATLDLSEEAEYNFTITEYRSENDSSEEALNSIDNFEGSSAASTDVDSLKPEPEMAIGLLYNSKSGRLTVEIIQGINLSSSNKNKEFYAKLSLFSAIGKELSHTKSSIRKGGFSPFFRESFIFQIAQFQLKEVTLMISVFSKKSIHRKEMIGWLAFGYKSSGPEEINHWDEVRESEEIQQISRCHKLQKSSISAKNILK